MMVGGVRRAALPPDRTDGQRPIKTVIWSDANGKSSAN
jgi:hypothetical protein